MVIERSSREFDDIRVNCARVKSDHDVSKRGVFHPLHPDRISARTKDTIDGSRADIPGSEIAVGESP